MITNEILHSINTIPQPPGSSNMSFLTNVEKNQSRNVEKVIKASSRPTKAWQLSEGDIITIQNEVQTMTLKQRRRIHSAVFTQQRLERHLHTEAILHGKNTLKKGTSTEKIPGTLEIGFSSYGIITVVLLGQKAILTIAIYWFHILFLAQNQHLTYTASFECHHKQWKCLIVPILRMWKLY